MCGVIFIYDGEAKQAEQLDMGRDGASGTQARIKLCERETEAGKNQEHVLEPGQEAVPTEWEMQVRLWGTVRFEELNP